jgi:hypothetical protein
VSTPLFKGQQQEKNCTVKKLFEQTFQGAAAERDIVKECYCFVF